MATRGERNKNPGNIRVSNQIFQGEVTPSQDEAFKQFSDELWGIRAIAKILINYYKLYGLDTVRKAISRWAPGNENDTEAYITDVCNRTGFGADDSVDLTDNAVLANIVTAIIWHENGECVYDDSLIKKGVALA